MVNTLLSTPAQTAGGKFVCPVNGGGSPAETAAPIGPLRQGTEEAGFAAKVLSCCCWSKVGPKMEELVSKGTEFCESCRKPSNAAKMKVLSFWIGAPTEPPN